MNNFDCRSPSIAVTGDSSYVITWVDNSNIYAQGFYASGNAIDIRMRINDDQENTNQSSPSIAAANDGSYVITWGDSRNSNYGDIYAQRFDANGKKLGKNVIINDDQGNNIQYYPSIAMADNGSYVITWTDKRNGLYQPDIYAQRFDSSGNPIGENVLINDDKESRKQDFPSIAMKDDGSYVITWTDYRNSGYGDIYAQRFDSSGNPIGNNVLINDDKVGGEQGSSSIAMADNGSYVITWSDSRNGNTDIYSQRFDSSGNSIGENDLITDEKGSSAQYYPDIAIDGNGNFVISWLDNRNNNPDIYAQRFDSSGNPIGNNVLINDDQGNNNQSFPSIAMSDNGSYVITWTDYRNKKYGDVYAQRFDANGKKLGKNILINDDQENSGQYPSIAMSDNGFYVITWEDYRNDNSDIYAQRFNASGYPMNTNVLVNEDNIYKQHFPSIAMKDDGTYIITWESQYFTNPTDIYAQRFYKAGKPIGENFQVNDDQENTNQSFPSIAMSDNGSYVITWSDRRNRKIYGDIYAQRFDANGKKLGKNVIINDDQGNNIRFSPSIAMSDDGSYVITWSDNRNNQNILSQSATNHDIYAQIFDNSGNAMGKNIAINKTYQNNYSSARHPSIKIFGSNIYATWDENRYTGKSFDIFFKIFTFSSLPLVSTVYPGDTNNDGTVDELDILPIGVYFFEKGTSRNDASTVWEGQDVTSWPSYPANYADCNGDGTVDEKDIIPVGVNWGSTRTTSIQKHMINTNDKLMLARHKNAFETIYNSVEGLESTPANAIKQLLETALEIIPKSITLHQCYPNPFNPSTEIRFSLPEAMDVSLKVYDINGRQITTLINGTQLETGYHNITFNGEAYPSGMYIYVLGTKNSIKAQKMMLIK
ncbi:MAG: T9SS type A sorting domain-containing protein [Candidatus Marinimicrobia bacterium]|nr:T9SS type A sorting domain-containing protein [Candidatus Neomarinimicrobiota bacterium]